MAGWRQIVIALSVLGVANAARAQGLAALLARPHAPVFRMPTAASDQLHSDVLVYGAWRIQRNEVTGGFLLLNPDDRAVERGSEDRCREEFRRLRSVAAIPPLKGRAVLTLHGFGRSRDHMRPLGERLCEQGDIHWINVTYSSTRGTLEDHAEALAAVIDGLEGIDQIDVIGHSMGNLVVRRYLGEAKAEQPRWKVDSRLRRMVMLGPPNQGARVATMIADLVQDSELARLLTGPSAWQLARCWDDACTMLATPAFEFGVIAGGVGDDHGFNPLLAGDDDLVVRVEETRLAGAADFRLVACRHGRMMRDSHVQELVLRFLNDGCFTTAVEKQPIGGTADGAAP